MSANTSNLESQPFLKGMNTRHLELLAEDSLPSEFHAGDRILNEGGSANRFYLILEGQVEVESSAQDGESVSIQTLGPGDMLGCSWLFPPYCWRFDARAVTQTKTLCFYGTRLRKLCEENHDLGYELMKRVSEVVVQRLQAVRLKLVEHNKHLQLS
jgi:CRP-like cAMP-binding protein